MATEIDQAAHNLLNDPVTDAWVCSCGTGIETDAEWLEHIGFSA